MDTLTRPTPLLDYTDPALQELLVSRGWADLEPRERARQIYLYVRDEIPFGYNEKDALPASKVLADGYGQCNTKTILLMALLRAAGIPSRFHGATIHKRLQKGVVTGLAYRIAPDDIVHSWAEIEVDGRWIALEGVILDEPDLDGVRSAVCSTGPLLGYGAGTEDIASPQIDFVGDDTFIQAAGINNDLGVYDDPDAFYAEAGGNFGGFTACVFTYWVRHRMNRRVARIRRGRA